MRVALCRNAGYPVHEFWARSMRCLQPQFRWRLVALFHKATKTRDPQWRHRTSNPTIPGMLDVLDKVQEDIGQLKVKHASPLPVEAVCNLRSSQSKKGKEKGEGGDQ